MSEPQPPTGPGPVETPQRTGELPGRDELAETCRRAWFYADQYPLNRRWWAVADAIIAAHGEPAADVPEVDSEVRLIAVCLDAFRGADAETVRRVCSYVLARLAPNTYPPQAF